MNESAINKLLALICLILGLAVLTLPVKSPVVEGLLTATSLDVGQGDSLLIRADGLSILIDAGGRPDNPTGMAEYVVIPYLQSQGINKLDMVFNTHPDIDHIGGIFAVIDEMPVDCLAVFTGYPDNQNQAQLLKLAAEKRVPVKPVAAGDVYKLSDNLGIRVLSPAADEQFAGDMVNDGSLVLQISYQDFDLLVTGDLQGEHLWSAIQGLDCEDIEVLQLPHHGSRYSYAEDWYAKFSPEAVFISVGRGNSYGHPGAEVVDYWQNRQVPVWRTDLYGSCQITFLEGQISFETVLTPDPPEELMAKMSNSI